MIRRTILFLLTTLLSISFFACKHKTDVPVPSSPINTGGGNGGSNGNNNGGSNPDTGLCFQRDILPIFISNCAKSGCHDAASHKDGFVFDSWENITKKDFEPGDPKHSELYQKITEDDNDKIMPPPPNASLTAQQIALIKQWIMSGAPNTVNCNSGCDSAQFAYTTTIKPLLDNNCKGCHNSSLSSGGHSFETFASTEMVVNSGKFLGAIKHQTGFSAMPKGGVKLSDCQMMKIEKWIASGSPNN